MLRRIRTVVRSVRLIASARRAKADAPDPAPPPPTFSPPAGAAPREYFEALALWFLDGFLRFRGRARSRVYYPGQPGRRGALVDGLEGFSRALPLFAAWVGSGRSARVRVQTDEVDILDLAAEGFRAGTDPNHPGFWGRARNEGQILVEAHDLALSFWLLKAPLLERLGVRQAERAAAWLLAAAAAPRPQSNWALFPAVIELCLADCFPGRVASRAVAETLAFVQSLHAGRGWFRDGPAGPIDYYSAWGFQYSLAWIRRLRPGLLDPGLEAACRRFAEDLPYFLGPEGFPPMGRSLSYRTAVPAPLIAGAHFGWVPPSLALRALDRTWRHFISRGCLADGTLTQGFHGRAPRTVEHYTGPGSPLWGLRSLVWALLFPRDSEFWASDPDAARLPVEEGPYEWQMPELGWTVRASEGRRIEWERQDAGMVPEEAPHRTRGISVAVRALGLPSGPLRYDLKYGLHRYASHDGELFDWLTRPDLDSPTCGGSGETSTVRAALGDAALSETGGRLP